jgi:hypothetical protein
VLYRDIVLIPSKKQWMTKSCELVEGTCWWSISNYPKDKESLIGDHYVFLYIRPFNAIMGKGTIVGFGYEENDEEIEKKVIYFNSSASDILYHLDLTNLGYEPHTQVRGWAYRWFTIPELEKKREKISFMYTEESIKAAITKALGKVEKNEKGELIFTKPTPWGDAHD